MNCFRRNTWAARCRPFFLTALISLFPAHAANAFGVYVEQKTFGHSEAVPFGAISEGWRAPLSDGDSTQGYFWNEAGVHYAGWRLGVLSRYDTRVRYHAETLEFLQHIKNQQPLTLGRHYKLLLDVNHFKAYGARVAYTFSTSPSWSLSIGGSYLRLQDLLYGRLQGSATPATDKTYDFAFDVDYYYLHDALFARDNPEPRGHGYAFDVAGHWEYDNLVKVQFEAQDLFGWFYWPAAPRTVATGNTATKQLDANGYQYFNPLFSGRETTEALYQPLLPRAKLDVDYIYDAWHALARVQYTVDQTYPALGAAHAWPELGLFYGYYTWTTRALALGWRAADWRVELGSDHWNPRRAHYGTLQISWQWK